jgi:hypothetical protein
MLLISVLRIVLPLIKPVLIDPLLKLPDTFRLPKCVMLAGGGWIGVVWIYCPLAIIRQATKTIVKSILFMSFYL